MSQIGEIHVEILPDLSGVTAAFERASQAMASIGAAYWRASMDLWWKNRILFADTEKERRLIRREYSRATRKPALIHNGKKP
jgi:hypothetical protein